MINFMDPYFGVNPAASMRKAAQRRLEGLLRKAARAAKGRETKGVFSVYTEHMLV
jgi:hypothetical protein